MTTKKEDQAPSGTTEVSMAPIETGGNIQVARATAEATKEIEAAVFMARRFPRNYDVSWGGLMKACERRSFAALAEYSFPRGGKKISGPSVNLAREAARLYGNLWYGIDILESTADEVLIRGWAWDLEGGARSFFQDRFKKLIQRKGQGWIVPDERDLRELIFRRGAVLIRNALLSIMPRDFIEDAQGVCQQTLKSAIKDPESEKKKLILAFGKQRVTVEMINKYLGHEEWDLDDLVQLNNILNTVQDDYRQVRHYFRDDAEAPVESKPGESKSDTLARRVASKAGQGKGEDVTAEPEEKPTPEDQPPVETPAEEPPASEAVNKETGEVKTPLPELPKQPEREFLETIKKPNLALMLTDATKWLGGDPFVFNRVLVELFKEKKITTASVHGLNKADMINVICKAWEWADELRKVKK